MTSAAQVVTRLWSAMHDRDWDGVAACVAPEAVIEWPHTGERFTTRDAYVGVNRAYPEGWQLALRRVVGASDSVAALVVVEQDGQTFHCCAFYDVTDGQVINGAEYWLTIGAETPPAWRRVPS
jgi:ketosteroid isomerase-like protein